MMILAAVASLATDPCAAMVTGDHVDLFGILAIREASFIKLCEVPPRQAR